MATLTKLTTNISLEMTGDTKFYMVSAKQGDKATRYVVAKLLNNGAEYTIPTGSRAVVNIKKPDGKRVYNTCSFSGSTVTIELTNQALAASGTAYCDVEIRTSDNTQVITSASFTIEIEESMRSDDAILSANEFTELEDRVAGHIKDLQDTNSEVIKAEAARVKAESARVTAENQRSTSEQTRQKNEETRKSTEELRKSAESARATAENQRSTSEQTRQQNEETRKSAEELRRSAESARVTAENQRSAAEQTRQKNEETRKSTEELRKSAESARETAESRRSASEQTRQQNEALRQQQETERQKNTAAAVKNAESATSAAVEATKDCKDITGQAEEALENQEQLEATLNTATQIRQEVSQMQQAVAKAKEQVEKDKTEIDDTIQNSLLASAEKILESVQSYFERADALYSSMYLDCDGETPYLRVVTPIFIDGATPQVRNVNEGVEFDGGTPMSRLLVT